jgi:hypothetical protein
VLGDDFLSRAGAHHPMLGLLLNYAPWTWREMTRFAEYFRTLLGSQHFEKVPARLEDIT